MSDEPRYRARLRLATKDALECWEVQQRGAFLWFWEVWDPLYVVDTRTQAQQDVDRLELEGIIYPRAAT